MKKPLYYFLMALGASSIFSGIFLLFNGANFSAYFYALFIGIVLVGTTYYNHQQKNKRDK